MKNRRAPAGFLLSHIGAFSKMVFDLPLLNGDTAMATENYKRVELSGDDASGRDSHGSTLVPMLIAGLIAVVAGAVVIMMFV